MHVFEMVIWIVAISVLGGIVMTYLKRHPDDRHNGGLMGEVFGEDDLGFGGVKKKEMKECLERMDKMEERLRNLERIATDKKRNLADEIDRL